MSHFSQHTTARHTTPLALLPTFPQPGVQPHKAGTTPATSQSTGLRNWMVLPARVTLQSVYHSAPYAKYFAMVLIQDLVRACGYDVESYCLMLQLLEGLTFEGFSEVSVKIAVTVFNIGSKFFNSNCPRLWQLVAWSHNLVSRGQVIQCEEQVCRGYNFCLPMHPHLNRDELQALCFKIETAIFHNIV